MRTLYVDDYFLILAVLAGVATAGVAYNLKDDVYLQIYVGLGWVQPDADFIPEMLNFEKRIQVASALIWFSLYCVKLSFMAYFRKLVSRVWKMEIWWWIVLSVVIVCGLASIPMAFIICSNFTEDYMRTLI